MNERVAIYARVSTDEQAEKQTIENQIHACREYCANQGLEVVAEFRDEGISGAIPLDERPEGRRLLEVAPHGLFDCVVIYRLDRLAREMAQGLRAFKQLEKAGNPLVSVSESWDDSPAGRFMYREFMSIAELEKDLIRDRMMAGRARRVRSGKYQASVTPFGYSYTPETGQLKPHRDNAEVVRQIFQWALEGLGLKAIALRLDAAGEPPPSASHPKRRSSWGWHHTTVHKILTAPRYVGRNTYGGEPMTCPALVDEETFDAVQKALRQRRIDSPRNTKHVYALRRLVWCRRCGSRYMVKTRAPHRYYCCYRRARYGPKVTSHEGVKWSWPAEDLEEVVKAAIRGFESDPRRAAMQIKIYAAGLEQQARRQKDETSPLHERLPALEQQELRVLDWARRGLTTEEQMTHQLAEVRTERQNVKDKLEALQTKQELNLGDRLEAFAEAWQEMAESLESTADELEQAGARLQIKWNDRSQDEWRRVIPYYVDHVWIEDDGTVTIEGALPNRPAFTGGTSNSPRY